MDGRGRIRREQEQCRQRQRKPMRGGEPPKRMAAQNRLAPSLKRKTVGQRTATGVAPARFWKRVKITHHPSKYFTTNSQMLKMCLNFW